jgi:hypothetical protein
MPQILPVITAVATVASVAQGQRAARMQQRSFQEQQRASELQARRSRVRAIRESQLLRSRTQATGQAMGAAGGSAMAGGLTSLSSQLGSTVGFQTQMSGLSRNISEFESQSALAAGQAQLFGGIQKMTGITPRDAFSGLFA